MEMTLEINLFHGLIWIKMDFHKTLQLVTGNEKHKSTDS